MVIQVSLLASLVAGSAAVPARSATLGWKVLLEDGGVADDYAEYEKAEALLGQACDISSASGNPDGEYQSCMELANVLSVQEKFKLAERVLDDLTRRLEESKEATSKHIVESLLELANVRAALAGFDGSRAALQRIDLHFDRLATADKVKTQVRIAEFFLSVDRDASGGDALRAAKEILEEAPEYGDDDYVYAAYGLGRALESARRLSEGEAVLRTFVNQARERFERDGDIPGRLGRAYLSVANRLANIAKARGREEEWKRLRSEAAVWRNLHGPMGPGRVDPPLRKGQRVKPPKILSKSNPNMTPGALANQVQGRVELSGWVWPDGRLHTITVSKSLPYGLHWAAIGAARSWRFSPATVDGEPVKYGAIVHLDFSLR